MERKTVSGKKSFAGASHEFYLHRVLKLALIERLDLANRIHGGKCARENSSRCGRSWRERNVEPALNRNNQLFTETHLYNAN